MWQFVLIISPTLPNAINLLISSRHGTKLDIEKKNSNNFGAPWPIPKSDLGLINANNNRNRNRTGTQLSDFVGRNTSSIELIISWSASISNKIDGQK